MSLELGFMYLIALGRGEVSWMQPAPDSTYPPKPGGSTIPCLPDGNVNPDFYGPPAPVSLGGCGPENPVLDPEIEIPISTPNPSGLQAGSMTIFDFGVQSSGPSTYRPLDLDIRNLLSGGL